MRNDFYPAGSVRALMAAGDVNPQTAKVLQKRLETVGRGKEQFFSDDQFRIAESVCECLLPQHDHAEKIPLAVLLEQRLTSSKGKGWRYDVLPPEKKMMIEGMQNINAEALAVYKKPFSECSSDDQVKLLTSIQNGSTKADGWSGLNAPRFFTELLVMVTEIYYSHPFGREEIGDVSVADVPGWNVFGLDQLEAREPQREK